MLIITLYIHQLRENVQNVHFLLDRNPQLVSLIGVSKFFIAYAVSFDKLAQFGCDTFLHFPLYMNVPKSSNKPTDRNLKDLNQVSAVAKR